MEIHGLDTARAKCLLAKISFAKHDERFAMALLDENWERFQVTYIKAGTDDVDCLLDQIELLKDNGKLAEARVRLQTLSSYRYSLYGQASKRHRLKTIIRARDLSKSLGLAAPAENFQQLFKAEKARKLSSDNEIE